MAIKTIMLAEAIMLACLLGALGALYIFFTQEKPEPYKRPVETKAPKTKKKKRKKPQKQKIKQSKYTKPKDKKVAFVKHDLIAQSFFGHGDALTAAQWHPTGPFVFTASKDQTIRLWRTDSKDNKCVTTVEGYGLRGASLAEVSDGKTRVCAAAYGNLHFYSIKESKKKLVFKKKSSCKIDLQAESILARISVTGNWIVCVGIGMEDPSIKIYTDSGTCLHTETVNEFGISHAQVSNCGRWLAVCGGLTSVRVWYIKSTREGNWTGCYSALTLRGHADAVTAVNFSPCCTKAITSSKDGKVRVFHIDVRWQDEEDPRLETTIDVGEPVDMAAISTNCICATVGHTMYIYDRSNSKLLDTIPNVQHTVNGKVIEMQISPSGGKKEQILISGTDKHAYIYDLPK